MKKYLLITFLLLFSVNAYSYIEGNAKINYVVDGDTFDLKVDNTDILKMLMKQNIVSKEHINLKNKTFRVRLANIDTSESTHYDKSKNTKKGKETSNVVKDRYSYKEVKYICYKKGKYNRAICDIYTQEGNIGVWLIENNYSPYVTDFGRHPTQDKQFRNATLKAQNSITSNQNFDYSKLKNIRKPSKINMAKKGYSYFKNRKTENVEEVKEKLSLNKKDIYEKLKNLENKNGNKKYLSDEQVDKLKYLGSINYN